MVEWRTLDWLPGYEISEDGRLRRTRSAKGHPAGKLITGQLDARGYIRVHVAGQKTHYMHKLVCEAFHGPRPPDKTQVAHGDGVRNNNHYTNLRWATAAENTEDRLRHGNVGRNENHPQAKLTWAKVYAIRAAHPAKSISDLAAEYDVAYGTIAQVLRGRTWTEAA